MAKKKAKVFKPGDKVIWFKADGFEPREPTIAWACGNPCVMGPRVRVTRHKKDVEDGFGVLDRMDYVYPYDNDLWLHCMAWGERKAELYADLKELQKGKYR